jgi:hypothetical protein
VAGTAGHGVVGAAAVPRARGLIYTLTLALVLGALFAPVPAARAAGEAPPGPIPVAVYVNVDEMAALWPFRDPDTGAFPQEGTPEYAPYRAAWGQVIEQTFRELKRRMPQGFLLLPARSREQPYAFKIDVWIADMATSCDAPTYYKYLWVHTRTREGLFATNWDGLGVRSETLIHRNMPILERNRADVDAWVELWAQVPYLHLTPHDPDTPQEKPAPTPAPEAGL